MEVDHLIIFIKNPVKGTVKTRLARGSNDDYALNVYHYLLDKTRKSTENLALEKRLYYSNTQESADLWHPDVYKKFVQASGDLGYKMKKAFEVSFDLERKVVIIGSDCPDLTEKIINEAFNQLNKFDIVVGPSPDGGYYLIGMKTFFPFLFTDIEWSTSKVLKQTLTKIREQNLTYFLLPELNDIDTMEDWVEYLERKK
ncbi:MAG: TIGR04282 family arsenosugar biosynthesis glycosyltransferase [Saprospiraceae bacterium]|nr:TIGR04282 family arsenosugar biosynthesis glycosyltransferase [Saprospiraceae bacterium]